MNVIIGLRTPDRIIYMVDGIGHTDRLRTRGQMFDREAKRAKLHLEKSKQFTGRKFWYQLQLALNARTRYRMWT